MFQSAVPMCKKTVFTFLAITLLTVLLLVAVGYYLFHAPGHQRVVDPDPKGTHALVDPRALPSQVLGECFFQLPAFPA